MKKDKNASREAYNQRNQDQQSQRQAEIAAGVVQEKWNAFKSRYPKRNSTLQ